MKIKKQKEVTYTIKHVTVLFSKGEIVIGWEDDEDNIGSKVIPFGESGDDIPWASGEDFIEAIIEKAFDLDSCCVYLQKWASFR